MTSPVADADNELLDILDGNGRPTGVTKPRHLVHRDGDWHCAVNVWIINPQRGILLQRRIDDKDSWGGYWDVSCGGHLIAGDDSHAGAVRELQEELGIDVRPEDLHFLLTHRSSTRPRLNFINNFFNNLYLMETNLDLSDFHPQADEISALKFVSPTELHAMLSETPSPLVPHAVFYDALFRYLDEKYPQFFSKFS